jgi:hypothetical protein
MPARKHIHAPESRVVPRHLMFRSRISETNHYSQR